MAASILSVFTLADAMARVRSGFETTTRPAWAARTSTMAQVLTVASEHHLVLLPEAPREGEQSCWRRLEAVSARNCLPALGHCHLRELAVDVETDRSHPDPP